MLKKELQLYNTLTRQKETIYPVNEEYITLYTCGPTVYDFAHIGNFRTYIFEDLLKRVLLFFGYRVKHVMNITDVDDKTIKGAIKDNKTLPEYTKPFKEAFFEDAKILNIKPADNYPEATKYIKEMIEIITNLLAKKIAYVGQDKSIYFSIERFEGYGKLSHLKLDELETGTRVVVDEYGKENASDFVLWKAYDEKRDGTIFWDSPFGKGRPGWHMECSAMALKLLGKTIDIHCGGVDNIFPHHENEIAQSESFTNQDFVRYWCHSEHLLVDNKKMSKSLGNFYILKDLLNKGYSGKEIRYLLLQVHYRMQLNFTSQGLKAAKNSLRRVSDFIKRLQQIEGVESFGFVKEAIEKYLEKFTNSLADDLNISSSLAALFDFIRDVNIFCDNNQIGKKEAAKALEFLAKIDEVLAVLPLQEEKEKIPEEILQSLEKRNEARKNKEWQEADRMREQIFAKGYIIEDAPKGAILKKR